MIILEIVALVVAALFLFKIGSVSVSLIKSKMAESKEKEEKMWEDIKDALSSNSRYRLEDVLVLYDTKLQSKAKAKIQSRIDDLTITESDQKLENLIERKSVE